MLFVIGSGAFVNSGTVQKLFYTNQTDLSTFPLKADRNTHKRTHSKRLTHTHTNTNIQTDTLTFEKF